MAIYAIYADEYIYSGEHGMFYTEVDEYKNKDDAIDAARMLSYDVMDNYLCIREILWENATERANDYGFDDTRVDTFYEDERIDNLSYEVWEINPKGKSVEWLDETLVNTCFKDFINEYGIKCVAQV